MSGTKAIEQLVCNAEAICFDLDDTLVQTTYFNEQSLNGVAKVLEDRQASPDVSLEDMKRRVLQAKIDYGPSVGQLFQALKKALNIESDMILTELTVAYDRIEDANLRLFPGVTALLKDLIRHRLKICVITNGDAFRQWKKMMLLGIAELFDEVIISEAVGLQKPDPEIFRLALEHVSVEPSSAVFVGDDPRNDIKGARDAGMITVRVLQGRLASRDAGEGEQADIVIASIAELKSYLSGVAKP
jgi:putative hydrolase of the HAD superfamily